MRRLTHCTGSTARSDENVTLRRKRGLHDRAARPFVLPEHSAVTGHDTVNLFSAHLEDLRNWIDRDQVRRAVAPSVRRTNPSAFTRGNVNKRQLSAGSHNDDVVNYESASSAKPQPGTSVSVSEATLRDHTTEPLPASSTLRIPVAPNA